ncbi:DNA-repair protein complementing XP-A cells [Pancytospora philotis]|nr:DNA-repair protein complementing XP-A cells [Pancytospora philotis]
MEGGFFASEDTAPKRADEEDAVQLPVDYKESCMYCRSIPVAVDMRKSFGILVCAKCARSRVKLITKTKCKEEHLLTEEELSHFKYLERPNPRRGSWHDMQLYIEEEIAQRSIAKFGSKAEIERTRAEREAKIRQRKTSKIKKQVRTLKRNVLYEPKEAPHRHEFIIQGSKGVCACGLTVDAEEI